MALDVNVKIDLAQPIGKVGFGVPLILEESATKDVAYVECKSLSAVKEAGFAETTKVYKVAKTIFMQNDAPATIAVCATSDTAAVWLGNADNIAKAWRQVLVVSTNGTTSIKDIMPVIELTKDKIYFADVDVEDTTEYTVNDISRTVLVYAKATEDYPSAAAGVVGATAGKLAGSINYKNVIIKGISAQDLKDSEIEAIHAKGGMTIVLKAGDVVTSMGKSAGGDYLDLIDGIDYVINNITYKTQKTFNTMDKVTFDDKGISALESVCVSVMRDAYNNGIIATDENGNPMYSVNYAPRANTEASDRAVRHYKGGNFSFTVAGAIDFADVKGSLEI